ncbi:hypothetical protein [Streptomyces sp. NPDC088789]|uniref:hypothetical protein n=1 Tax=Streptomyces sp. NPDC088789 TaxID=3365899 RepID=UPI0037F56E86
MLRIIDARTGRPTDPAPLRRGLTRVEAYVSGDDLTALRVLLVADVLVRTLELGGTPVWELLDADVERAELRASAAALGIRPFEESRDVGQALGAAQAVHVVERGTRVPGGVVLAVAPVDPATGPPPPGTDPSALRLALLAVDRAEPARLDPRTLEEARATLTDWRGTVAGWARSPSRPVPAEIRNRLRAAWENDLDVPGVLRILHQVAAEPGLPDGARFETYAYADRLLALELTRDLGAPV